MVFAGRCCRPRGERPRFGGPARDRQLGLQLDDPAAGHHQFVVVVAPQARQEALSMRSWRPVEIDWA
jgi:hypothetical protein